MGNNNQEVCVICKSRKADFSVINQSAKYCSKCLAVVILQKSQSLNERIER